MSNTEKGSAEATKFASKLKPWLTPTKVNKCIDRYLQRGMFTGASFELLASTEYAFQYTERDLAAVSSLSITVPWPTRQWLLGEGAPVIEELLREIHPDANINTKPDDQGRHWLSEGGAAWEMWYLLNTAKGLGPTTISKLMAVKRPHLVPIHDSVVAKALDLSSAGSWDAWRTFMVSNGDVVAEARKAADMVTGGDRLSDLRVLDIAVWMGAQDHKKSGESDKDEPKLRFTAPNKDADILKRHKRRHRFHPAGP